MVLLWLFKEMPCHVGQNFSCLLLPSAACIALLVAVWKWQGGFGVSWGWRRDVMPNNLRINMFPLQCVWLYPFCVYLLLQKGNVSGRNKHCMSSLLFCGLKSSWVHPLRLSGITGLAFLSDWWLQPVLPLLHPSSFTCCYRAATNRLISNSFALLYSFWVLVLAQSMAH